MGLHHAPTRQRGTLPRSRCNERHAKIFRLSPESDKPYYPCVVSNDPIIGNVTHSPKMICRFNGCFYEGA